MQDLSARQLLCRGVSQWQKKHGTVAWLWMDQWTRTVADSSDALKRLLKRHMFNILLYIYTLYKQKAIEERLEAGRTEVMSFSMEKQMHLIKSKKHTMFNKSPELSHDPSDNLETSSSSTSGWCVQESSGKTETGNEDVANSYMGIQIGE